MTATRNKNVLLLALSQACFLSSSMTLVTFMGLAGNQLVADAAYATVAMSLVILSTAISTAPMSMLMQRTSRRFGFRLGASFGIAGGLLAAFSLVIGSFWSLCGAALLMGPFQSSAQYYRFAAAESVTPSEAPRAISTVLIGGLVAALFAPSITTWLNIQFGTETFIGAFLFYAALAALALVPLGFLRSLDKPIAIGDEAAPEQAARPLGQIIGTPRFLIAALNAGLGYAMMSFVMTATPLAVQACGLGSSVSSQVIQGHVIAMFLPSLFTGHLIKKFGIVPILLTGHVLFAAAFVTALSGIQIWQFSVALIALGIGWNFCFIGGSTLLTQVHSESEKGKVQGLNEFIVFGLSALSSFGAGVILSQYGWAVVNQAAFAMLVVAAGATSLWGVIQLNRRTAS